MRDRLGDINCELKVELFLWSHYATMPDHSPHLKSKDGDNKNI
jgi:hypothetical protein